MSPPLLHVSLSLHFVWFSACGVSFLQIEGCSSSSLWVLPPVGGDGLVSVTAAGLQGLVPVFSCVELALVSLKVDAAASGVFWGVCGLGMALRSLCVNRQCCLPILLMIWHVSSSPGSLLPLSGARPWCCDGGLWEASHQLTFHGAGSSLVVQHVGCGSSISEFQV